MSLAVQPGGETIDGGVFRRWVSVTESGAQSANFACHASDRSLHVSLTSHDRSVCAMVMTRDAERPLAKTLGGGAVSTAAAPVTPLSANGTRPALTRYRWQLGHSHRNAAIWDTPVAPWR